MSQGKCLLVVFTPLLAPKSTAAWGHSPAAHLGRPLSMGWAYWSDPYLTSLLKIGQENEVFVDFWPWTLTFDLDLPKNRHSVTDVHIHIKNQVRRSIGCSRRGGYTWTDRITDRYYGCGGSRSAALNWNKLLTNHYRCKVWKHVQHVTSTPPRMDRHNKFIVPPMRHLWQNYCNLERSSSSISDGLLVR